MKLPPQVKIKQDSILAKMAAFNLKANNMAIVFGNTIHLHGVSKQEFLSNDRWVKHELKHVAQFQHYGFINFLLRYVWESIKKGYRNNKFELEARAAENE
jgi:hypothetical protein